MRILLWAPFGAGTHYWGPGRSAFNLYTCGALGPDHEVHLAHGYEHQADERVFSTITKISNLTPGIFDQLKFLYLADRWIADNAHRFDVMHALGGFEYSLRPALQFRKAGKPAYVKITGEFGGMVKRSLGSRIVEPILRREKSLAKVSGVIAISEAIASTLSSVGLSSEKIIRIPNGVDSERFCPVTAERKQAIRRDLNIDAGAFVVASVGGLSARKRTKEAAKAVLTVSENFASSIKYLIVGPDRSGCDLLSSIVSLKNNEDSKDVLQIIGEVENPVHYLQASDVFLLPSITEGMPNALLEAMACGLPSVVTRIPGCTDLIIENVNGVFCDGSVKEISECINGYLSNSERCAEHGANARTRVTSEFSSQIVLAKHIAEFSKSYVTSM